jgi:hypothetical protein
MKRKITCFITACAATLILFIAGCGSGGTAVDTPATVTTVSGVAADGAPIVGQAFLKDSRNSAEKTAMIGVDGSFSFDVDGMTPPFIIKAEWTANGTVQDLYSFAPRPGTANINPLANAAIAGAAANIDLASIYANPDPAVMKMVATNLPASMADLQSKLKTLMDQYQVSADPLDGYYKADHTGLDALFDDVRIEVAGGSIFVSNIKDGSTIFTCQTNDIKDGVFTAANMPVATSMPAPTPTPLSGRSTYDGNCAGCHRLGAYDGAGSAPDLSGKGSMVDVKFSADVAGHKGITLSAQQILDVKGFLDAN